MTRVTPRKWSATGRTTTDLTNTQALSPEALSQARTEWQALPLDEQAMYIAAMNDQLYHEHKDEDTAAANNFAVDLIGLLRQAGRTQTPVTGITCEVSRSSYASDITPLVRLPDGTVFTLAIARQIERPDTNEEARERLSCGERPNESYTRWHRDTMLRNREKQAELEATPSTPDTSAPDASAE